MILTFTRRSSFQGFRVLPKTRAQLTRKDKTDSYLTSEKTLISGCTRKSFAFWEEEHLEHEANMSKHSSPTPRKLKIGSGSVVCQEAEIKGEVTIGSRTVIHPKARIIAEAGPIIIGDNNLIEEQATIVNSAYVDDDGQPGEKIVMKIGNHNVFEVGSQCEAVSVGDNNILEAKSKIGRYTSVSHGCVIGAKCEVTSQETLPENTVIYGQCCSRRVQGERPVPQTLQLDFLTKILPNYHHLKKSSRS